MHLYTSDGGREQMKFTRSWTTQQPAHSVRTAPDTGGRVTPAIVRPQQRRLGHGSSLEHAALCGRLPYFGADSVCHAGGFMGNLEIILHGSPAEITISAEQVARRTAIEESASMWRWNPTLLQSGCSTRKHGAAMLLPRQQFVYNMRNADFQRQVERTARKQAASRARAGPCPAQTRAS